MEVPERRRCPRCMASMPSPARSTSCCGETTKAWKPRPSPAGRTDVGGDCRAGQRALGRHQSVHWSRDHRRRCVSNARRYPTRRASVQPRQVDTRTARLLTRPAFPWVETQCSSRPQPETTRTTSPMTHVNGDDTSRVRSIARPLGDCPAEHSTPVFSFNPRGVTGTGCGFPYANVSWSTARYERESLFLTVDQPLDDGSTDACISTPGIATDELNGTVRSLGRHVLPVEATATGSKITCRPIRRGRHSLQGHALRVAHRFTRPRQPRVAARRSTNTMSRSDWRERSQTASATTRTCATTATIPPSKRATPS